MKTIRLLLLAVAAVIGFTASAFEFDAGNYRYVVDDNSPAGACVKGLSSAGANITSVNIPSVVTYNGVTYRVIQISYQAFKGNTKITNVTIQPGAYIILNEAFANCTNLTSVWLPSTLTDFYNNAFAGCSKLKTVYYACYDHTDYPAIYANNFPSNSGMTLYLPTGCKNDAAYWKGLDGWGKFANVGFAKQAYDFYFNYDGQSYYACLMTHDRLSFSDWKSSSNRHPIVITGAADSATKFSLGYGDFGIGLVGGDNQFLPIAVVEIAPEACKDHASLVTVDLGNCKTLKMIGKSAFLNCPALTSATVLCEEIGSNAFYGCSAMTTFTPNEGIKRYSSGIIAGTAVKTLHVPASLTKFGYAADGAKKCFMITVADGNQTYAQYNNELYTKDLKTLIRHPEYRTTIDFPEQMTMIGSYAFWNCFDTQETIEVPYGVTSIGTQAFYNCTKLKKIVLPSTIGTDSFSKYILTRCDALTDLYVNLPTAPTVESAAKIFYDASLAANVTLHLPYAGDSSTQYKNAGWTGFKGYEYGLDQAYDFKLNLSSYGIAHFTVTSNSGVNFKDRNGVWTGFGGTVKMVSSPEFTASGTVTIPDEVTYHGKRYAITAMGPYSLYNRGSNDFSATGGWYVNNIEEGAGFISAHLTGVDLPNVKSIANLAFYGATSLSSFTISKDIQSIGNGAFATTKLSGNMILPYGIKTIGAQAFMNTKLSRLLIPSSVTSLGGNVAGECTNLNELVINIDANKTASDGIVLSNIGTAKIRVPVGQVGQYKQHNVYKNLASQIEAGGYDFIYGENYDSSPGYMYHMTVIWPWSEGDTYTNSEGTEYENVWGWAQYVYHPNIKGGTTFYTDEVETDKRTGKRYIMVALGDSVFAGANNLEVVDGTLATILSIGHHAFESTAVKHRLTFPNALSVGELAFSNMTKCPEVDLLTPIDLSNYFKDSYIFDRNRDDFKMYVDNTYFKKAYDYCMDWDMGDGHYANQLRPFIHATGEVMPVSCFLEWVNYTSLGLEAYSVTGYDESAKTLKLTKHDDHTLNYQENGVILTGLEKDQIYKLEPWAGGEGLVSTADWDNYLTENWEAWTLKSDDPLKRWGWNATDKKFVRPASSMSIPGGSALLYIGDSAPALNIDEWTLEGVGNKYDVNGDGNVDVGDVNAILEAILNHNNSSKYDVNNDNNVDVGDVNAVLGYILEHS